MKQNINNHSSISEKFSRLGMTESVQENTVSSDDLVAKNKEQQQEQTRYLNRVLEAYGDCV